MASKLTENSIAGDLLIAKELCKHLRYTPEKTKMILELAKQGVIAVETLLECAIAKVGKIKRLPIQGMDFDDGTDAKKVTVSINDSKLNTCAAPIRNVSTKTGALRVMVASPLSKEIYYFLIPNKEIGDKVMLKIMFTSEGKRPKSRMKSSFSNRCWEEYRVNTFKELCQRVK